AVSHDWSPVICVTPAASIRRSSPVIDEHQPLISPIPPPALRRAVHGLKPFCELRRNVEHRGRKVSTADHTLAHDGHRCRSWRKAWISHSPAAGNMIVTIGDVYCPKDREEHCFSP